MFEEILRELGERKESTAVLLPDGHVALHATYQELREPMTGRVVFVDGGNGTVYERPGALVEFVRLAMLSYEGAEKCEYLRREGMLFLREEGSTISARGFGIPFEFKCRNDDPELRLGSERVSLPTIAGLCRFMLECTLAAEVGGDLVIRDGQLQATNQYEAAVLDRLSGLLAGLAKTSNLLTDTGESACDVVSRRGPRGTWLYGLGDTCIVKLHANARQAFRLDAPRLQREIAATLAALSHDPAFLGYPYPLLLADRLARIPNEEIRMLRIRFAAEAGRDWQLLEAGSRILDAHELVNQLGR